MLSVTLLLLGMPLTLRGSRAQSVAQPDHHVTVAEGHALLLKCNYTYSATPYLFWYVQRPGQGLQLLLKYFGGSSVVTGNRGFKAEFKKSETSFHLQKSSAQGSDAAMYFCALSLHTGKLIFGQGTSLQIKPVIENPEPAVYQLRDPKSRNTSVCLFTDFDSNVNLSESVLPGVPHTQPTVLNMKSLDSKSNAAVAWSSKSNFDCRNTFGDPTFYPSSDYPCNATLVEESFETDMNLNLENLSVMALRILLLKVAGFNLLMTLRLWSS